MVTKEDIITQLSQLGLKRGDKVMVHSSLSRFGHVEGGADTVIEALMEILTPEGILIMPSFNHGRAYEDGGMFDIASTPTSNGKIPDTFWRKPGVLRSMNPTHAFAAWGKTAAAYTSEHHLNDAMGDKSPLGLLWKNGGYGLLLGVDYHANTFHHFVETHMDAPCLSKRGEVYPVRFADGREGAAHTWGWREKGCPITDGARYAEFMQPYHRQTHIGEAVVTLYALRDGFNVIRKCLTEGVDGFPPCSACTNKPRKCIWTV